jgi:ankyrin repeat protein
VSGDVHITKDVVIAAAKSGQEEVLKLIDKGYRTGSSEEKWFSIAQFYNSAKAGDEKTIRRFLAQGIKPDLENPRNVSPLWVAATNGHLTVVEILLDTQAVDINARSISGRLLYFGQRR